MRTRRLTLSLFALGCSATATLCLATSGRQTEVYPAAGMPSFTVTRQAAIDAVEAFSVITERPLFSPSRRPNAPREAAPVSMPQPVAPVPLAPPAATLVGILLSPEGGAAVLRLADGKSSSLTRGDRLGEWVLVEIEPDRIVLTSGGERHELTFPTPQRSASPAPVELSNPQAPRRRR